MGNQISLTSAEVGNLWLTYMNCTMSTCVLRYFLAKVEDEQIRPVLQYALDLSVKITNQVTEIYQKENRPIPTGFTSEDVDIKAPRLFSDTFFILYLKHMARVGMASYSLALALATRPEICDLFSSCVYDTVKLNNQSLEVLLSKGIAIRPPSIFLPEKVEFVNKQGFLGFNLGKKRPLTAIEIAHIFANIQTNLLGKELLMGLGQVAKNKQINKYINRGADIAKEHIKIMCSHLEEEDLPIPMHWDIGVVKSSVSPFSDKLMIFHTLLINNVGLSDFGASLGVTLRADIFAAYSRLVTETTEYGEDGINLMIENKWFEQPPITSTE